MKLELMKDCLASWIQFQGLSVAQLTEMLGFKSKTSVFRLLQGKSNEQSIKKMNTRTLVFLGSLTRNIPVRWNEQPQYVVNVV